MGDSVEDHFKLVSYLFSNASSFRASWALVASSWRRRTKVRMISMLTWTARLLLKTLESMAISCSVNTYGEYRRPPRPVGFDIPIWNLKTLASSAVS